MQCRKDGQCVTNNNNQTGFVTALIFSVVTEQTIGKLVSLLRQLDAFKLAVSHVRVHTVC